MSYPINRMKQEVSNYGRFWVAFRQLTLHADPEECRREFVRQYTAGRTDSLREMHRGEYDALCAGIEGMVNDIKELKLRRSTVLKLLQELEVDTTDCEKAQINQAQRVGASQLMADTASGKTPHRISDKPYRESRL